jgi:uncharacterized membrane protein
MEFVRHIARYLLGAALIYAGVSHFTFSRAEFQAQVPPWLPLDADFVVLASGAVEIALGIGLIFVSRFRKQIGWLTAAFFLAIFPGNISQYLTQTDAFGLNTDEARAIRLAFQPLLILWALWSTAAWSRPNRREKEYSSS